VVAALLVPAPADGAAGWAGESVALGTVHVDRAVEGGGGRGGARVAMTTEGGEVAMVETRPDGRTRCAEGGRDARSGQRATVTKNWWNCTVKGGIRGRKGCSD
jgi:hypothetical protein